MQFGQRRYRCLKQLWIVCNSWIEGHISLHYCSFSKWTMLWSRHNSNNSPPLSMTGCRLPNYEPICKWVKDEKYYGLKVPTINGYVFRWCMCLLFENDGQDSCPESCNVNVIVIRMGWDIIFNKIIHLG